MIITRDIESISEIRSVQALIAEVWQVKDLDIVPLTNLVAIKEVGGILLGAFSGEELVGFALGFMGRKMGQLLIHSQMVAVKPAYRNLNLGYKLKLEQRERALAQGITIMTWTFDPLQSPNAHFNFGKLGVIADSYKIDFYGEGTSSFLHRTGTDRLWVSWLLDSKRVKDQLERSVSLKLPATAFTGLVPMVQVAEDGGPRRGDTVVALSGPQALIEIPADNGSLAETRPDLAVRWREATRWAFTRAFAAGYVVTGFDRDRNGERPLGTYLLKLPEQADEIV